MLEVSGWRTPESGPNLANPSGCMERQRELLRAEALLALAQEAEDEAAKARSEARTAADRLPPTKKQTDLARFFEGSARSAPWSPALAAFAGVRGARPQYALTSDEAAQRPLRQRAQEAERATGLITTTPTTITILTRGGGLSH